MVCVSDAGEAIPEEGAGTRTLDTVEDPAAGLAMFHLLPPLSSILETSVSTLLTCGVIPSVIHRLVTLKELSREEVTWRQGICCYLSAGPILLKFTSRIR